jgi:hypothetical protein
MTALGHPLLFWTLALATLLCGCASFERDYRVFQCKIEDLHCDAPDVQAVLAAQKARFEAKDAAALERERKWQERQKQDPAGEAGDGAAPATDLTP